MEEFLVAREAKKKQIEDIQRYIAYVLFAGVILVVLMAFFLLTLIGKVHNIITTNSTDHFMYYSQIYLKFCAMMLAPVLIGYYATGIYKAVYLHNVNVRGFLKNNAMLIPLAAMLVWTFIALFQSPDFDKSLNGSGYINEGFYTVLQYGTVFLAAYAVREKLKFSKEALLWTFVIVASIVCFIMFGSLVLGYGIGLNRKNGVFNNSNHYGYFLAMSTTATFALLVYNKNVWKVTLLSVLLALNMHNLLYCNTLGANLAFIGGIVFILCSGYMSGKINNSSLVIALLVCGVVTFIDEVWGVTKMWESYVTLFRDLGLIADSATGGTSDPGIAGTGRYSLWRRTIKVIHQVPWFGKGLDLYYRNNIYDHSLDVPHNEYLAIASNIGIPGLVMYLFTFIWWFAKAVQQKKNLSTADLAMLAGTFAYMVSAFTGNSFTYTYPYFMVFFVMSMQSSKPVDTKYSQLQNANTPEAMEKREPALQSETQKDAKNG